MSSDGQMSASKVRAKQPELQEALEKGLKWTIIKREAVKRWPIITQLVQSTRQIAGQLHNGETHFELMENIVALASEIPISDSDLCACPVVWAVIGRGRERPCDQWSEFHAKP